MMIGIGTPSSQSRIPLPMIPRSFFDDDGAFRIRMQGRYALTLSEAEFVVALSGDDERRIAKAVANQASTLAL